MTSCSMMFWPLPMRSSNNLAKKVKEAEETGDHKRLDALLKAWNTRARREKALEKLSSAIGPAKWDAQQAAWAEEEAQELYDRWRPGNCDPCLVRLVSDDLREGEGLARTYGRRPWPEEEDCQWPEYSWNIRWYNSYNGTNEEFAWFTEPDLLHQVALVCRDRACAGNEARAAEGEDDA